MSVEARGALAEARSSVIRPGRQLSLTCHVVLHHWRRTAPRGVRHRARGYWHQTRLPAAHKHTLIHAAPSTHQPAGLSEQAASTLVTFEEVQKVASLRGLNISLKTLGPLYRIVCRAAEDETKIFAVTNGFVAPPFKLVHCDTLQVFTRGLRGSEGERIRGGVLGVGLLLGGATFSYALSCGCTKAEILAINDDDSWHERLLRYYSYFGFKRVRSVGDNGLRDIPDLLVWGGVGTRMDADVESMLRKWTPAFRSRLQDSQQRAEDRRPTQSAASGQRLE